MCYRNLQRLDNRQSMGRAVDREKITNGRSQPLGRCCWNCSKNFTALSSRRLRRRSWRLGVKGTIAWRRFGLRRNRRDRAMIGGRDPRADRNCNDQGKGRRLHADSIADVWRFLKCFLETRWGLPRSRQFLVVLREVCRVVRSKG